MSTADQRWDPELLPPLLTIEEAAQFLRVAPKTIRRRIADRSLRAHRVGPRAIRVTRESLLALVRPVVPPPPGDLRAQHVSREDTPNNGHPPRNTPC